MRRNRFLAAIALIITPAIAVSITSCSNGSATKGKSDHTPTPTRSTEPTPTDYQIVGVDTTSSFRVNLGGRGLKGEHYDVTFKRGDLTRYKPNLASVAQPIPPGGFSNGNGTILGRACKFDHKIARVYPFSVSITKATTSLNPIDVYFDAYGVSGDRESNLPEGRVQMEFADSGGNTNCYPNIKGGSFHMPADPKMTRTMTGWIILSGEGTTKGLRLSVASQSPFSGVAANTVTDVAGEFSPHKVETINGRGRITNGGAMPLMPNAK